MSGPRPIADDELPVPEVVERVYAAMCALGFVPAHRSPSGSYYLRLPEFSEFDFRLSDHKLGTWTQEKFARSGLLYSAVIQQPKRPADIPNIAFAFGIRFICRARDRKGLVRSARENAA